jgi:hypothetical protein
MAIPGPEIELIRKQVQELYEAEMECLKIAARLRMCREEMQIRNIIVGPPIPDDRTESIS